MSNIIPQSPEPKIERLPAVQARTGLGRSAIYAAISRGDFVQPIKLGARSIGFLSSEVDAWLFAKAAQRPPAKVG